MMMYNTHLMGLVSILGQRVAFPMDLVDSLLCRFPFSKSVRATGYYHLVSWSALQNALQALAGS